MSSQDHSRQFDFSETFFHKPEYTHLGIYSEESPTTFPIISNQQRYELSDALLKSKNPDENEWSMLASGWFNDCGFSSNDEPIDLGERFSKESFENFVEFMDFCTRNKLEEIPQEHVFPTFYDEDGDPWDIDMFNQRTYCKLIPENGLQSRIVSMYGNPTSFSSEKRGTLLETLKIAEYFSVEYIIKVIHRYLWSLWFNDALWKKPLLHSLEEYNLIDLFEGRRMLEKTKHFKDFLECVFERQRILEEMRQTDPDLTENIPQIDGFTNVYLSKDDPNYEEKYMEMYQHLGKLVSEGKIEEYFGKYLED